MASLTPQQFARAAALEEHQVRLARLSRMTSGQLCALLGGDPTEAVAWVRSAAESGMPAAQVRLGRMLLEGRGLPQDPRTAFLWFRRAAEKRDADALNMVGRCHELGWGVAMDLSLAAVYYRASAEAGFDWGQYNLANLLFDGRGVGRDLNAAFIWFLRASNQGHARAMNLLARCLEEGWGCRRSLSEADYWFRRSAEVGYFRGQYNHGIELLRRGECAVAAVWLSKAAAAGDIGMRRTIKRLLAELNNSALNELILRASMHEGVSVTDAGACRPASDRPN